MRFSESIRIGLALVVMSFATFTGHVGAQTPSTGALTGVLTDESDSVIPGATVTITNTGTSQTRSAVTNETGAYRANLLEPGTYSVKIELSGFRTVTVPSVVVRVTEVATLNAKLTVGALEEAIVVTGLAPLIQTQNATVGNVVSGAQMTEIPLATRNFTQTLGLAAGVGSAVNNSASLGRGSQDMYVNGQPGYANVFQVDGVTVNNWAVNTAQNHGNQMAGIAVPNPDSIQEFKIQTSLYDAGYGRSAGASVDVITKAGTNVLHGALFEFFRDDAMNANDFFRERAGLSKPELKQNQFGGTLGGPIVRNRFFMFGSYQGTRQRNGLTDVSLTNVVLPALTADRSRATLGQKFCPENNAASTTRFGGVQVACDGSNINPVALAMLNYRLPDGNLLIPSPNSPGNIGSFSVPAEFREDQLMLNSDFVIGENTLSQRYFYSRAPQTLPIRGNVPGTPVDVLFVNQNGTGRLTSILSTNIVNEARVGVNHITGQQYTVDLPLAPDLGMKPWNSEFPVMPVISAAGSFVVGANAAHDYEDTITMIRANDQLSLEHKDHSLRVGGSAEFDRWDVLWLGRRGQLNFQSFPDFLLGMSAAQNGTNFSNVFGNSPLQAVLGHGQRQGLYHDLRTKLFNAFFQDDFRVASNLMVNLGLRWEYNGEIGDNSQNFGVVWTDVASAVPVPPRGGTLVGFTVPANYEGELPAGVTKRPNSSLHRTTDANNFVPRVGFAWRPVRSTDRVVVRGGYGTFYLPVSGTATAVSAFGNAPFSVSNGTSGADNADATLQTPWPPMSLGFDSAVRTETTRLSDTSGYADYRTPRTHQYNVNVQIGLLPRLVAEIGYVGSVSRHLAGTRVVNLPRLASASAPLNCELSTGCVTTNTVANAALRVPLVGYAVNALSQLATVGRAEHNSLQLTLRQLPWHGVSFQTAYTYGRTLSDLRGNTGFSSNHNLNDPLDPVWGLADYDRTHRLVANYNWDLPGVGSGFASALTTGWSFSGVIVLQGGLPLTLTDAAGGTIYGSGSPSTAFLCPGASVEDLATPGSTKDRLNNYFDGNVLAGGGGSRCGAFPVSPFAADGRATGFGNLGKGVIRGPGQANWDLALAKRVNLDALQSYARLEFRFEVFNVLNTLQFSDPGTAVGTGTFGRITSTSAPRRIMQLALKYLF